MIKIEKGIPIARVKTRESIAEEVISALEKMQVGESFALPIQRKIVVRSAIWVHQQDTDKRFCTRTVDDQIRVWRQK